MNFYIWNKEDEVCGVDAKTILRAKKEFMFDDVIVIYDKYGTVLHFETRGLLRLKYNVDSIDPIHVAVEIIEKLNNGYTLQNNGFFDNLKMSDKELFETIMYDMRIDEPQDIHEDCVDDGEEKEEESLLKTLEDYIFSSLNVDEYEITEISGNLIIVNNNSIIHFMDLGVSNCGFLSHVSLKKLTKKQIIKLIKQK